MFSPVKFVLIPILVGNNQGDLLKLLHVSTFYRVQIERNIKISSFQSNENIRKKEDWPFYAVLAKKKRLFSDLLLKFIFFLLADLFLIFIHAKFITGSKLIFILKRGILMFSYLSRCVTKQTKWPLEPKEMFLTKASKISICQMKKS